MPFTLSHPAAVVPLARRGLPLSALVIGSMTPDLPYFVEPSAVYGFGHTFKGVFAVCLPLGLFVLWVFHQFLKRPMLSLLPRHHRLRLTPLSHQFHCKTWYDFWMIALGVVLGAFTHLTWDSITHYSGWMYEELPVFRTPLWTTSNGAIHIFDFLQYFSTAFGLAFIVYCYFKWYQAAPEGSEDVTYRLPERLRHASLLAMSSLALLVAVTLAFLSVPLVSITSWVQPLARYMGIAVIRIGTVELLLYCLFWHWNMRRQRV